MQLSRGSAHVLVSAAVAVIALIATAIGVSTPGALPPPPPPPGPGDTAIVHGPRRYDAPIGSSNTIQTFVDSIPVVMHAYNRYVIRVKNGNPDGTQRVQRALVGTDSITGSMAAKTFEIAVKPTTLVNVAIRGQASAGHLSVELLEINGGNFTVFGTERFSRANSNSDVVFNRTFTVGVNAGAPFFLWIVNGNPKLAGVIVKLNADTVVGPAPRFANLTANTAMLMMKVSPVSGSNTLVITLPKKQSGFIDLTIMATDITRPVLTISAPSPDLITRFDTVTARGTVTDQSPVRLTVNGAVATMSGNTFSKVVRLPEGHDTLRFSAVDAAGNRTDSTRNVTSDRTAPVYEILTPSSGFITNQTSIVVSGTVSDNLTAVTMFVDDSVPVTSGTFSKSVPLIEGENTILVYAYDAAGNTSGIEMLIGTRDTQPPVLTVTAPVDGAVVNADHVTVSGSVSDASLASVVAGTALANLTPLTVAQDGTFSGDVPIAQGSNVVAVAATDSAGNHTTITRSVTRSSQSLPPDPATVATAIDPTVPTNLAGSTAFLYTGSNSIQTGVAPGTIQPVRAAVLRGKVLMRDGQVLPGATITILAHPELGQTLSRADGMFDFAVNGGEPLVLQYAKPGYLSAQRTVAVPWQDFVPVDDVVLTALDAQVTTVNFSAPVQVARGSVVSDTDGMRQATLLFKQGTTAEMVLPDGSARPLDTLHVRATEYTVGPNGPKAMPAPLPPTSGYTYAAEVSVDEALAAGATSVRFSRPVPYYLENFLRIRPGMRVPLAVYDRVRAAWMPLDDGRVIEVVGEQNGRAELDTDGDGSPDGAATLDSLGIDDAELVQLAALYDPNQTLWRFALDHLSPLDGNNPVVSPDAQQPGQPTPNSEGGGGNGDGKNSTDNPNECPGSIIECENQVLGERIGIVGTGLTLNYRSNRVLGRTASYQAEVTLSGDSVPPGLRNIVLEVNVAGRQFIDTFPPAPNLKDTVTWDGRDTYGRVVQGAQPALVRIHYVYDRTYYAIPAATARSFGLTCRGDTTGFMLSCLLPGTDTTQPLPARGRGARTQEFHIVLGAMGAYAGLGGWTLSGHHTYDPVLRTLYLGTGERQTAEVVAGVQTIARAGADWPKVGFTAGAQGVAVGDDGAVYVADLGNDQVHRISWDGVIELFAGNGQSAASGDGGPALSAGMNPLNVEVGPGGSVYVADNANNRIRRINARDTIETVAGNGTCVTGALAPDGSTATAVELCSPERFAVGPDGSLYIAYWDVVWRVGPDGLVYRVAGLGTRDGEACYYQDFGFNEICQDEILATSARIGFIGSLALGPDGSIYIGDVYANVIRRVTPDGIIHRFAGTGMSGSTGDGGPAVDATMWEPSDLFVGPDGTVYFVDDWYRIRRISSGGTITTIAGNGQLCSTSTNPTCSEGAPALQAQLNAPYAVTQGPDGTIYYTETFGDRVRRLLPPMPGFRDAEYVVAAADGSALYGFDRLGRHLRTLDTRTGAVLAAFAYDSAGRLVAVTDADSNVVTIERDGTGNPTAIVAPFGQRTVVSVDTAGYLSSATDPAQQSVMLTYHGGGLLATLTDARSGIHRYTYDGRGRLTRDEDPAGGFTDLTRSAGAFSVTRTLALDRSWRYDVERLGDGTEKRLGTGPSGTVLELSIKPDATTHMVGPDSVVTDWSLGPDPRFGMQAPLLRFVSVRLPSGLTSNATAVRRASLSNPADPLSLVSQVDSVNINGNWTVSTYGAAAQRLVQTSPAGRQVFATLDSKGRTIAAQVAGLDSLRLAYDARGRVREQQAGGRLWTYTYDARGRLRSTVDPLGRLDSLYFDDADRLVRRVLPDGRAVLFGYDANGNLTSLTPPGRPPHGFQYTALDLAGQYDPPGIPGPKPSRYFYGLERQLDSIARPDSVAIRFEYDSAGRTSSMTFDRGTLTFGYSPASGNLTALRTPSGDSLTFSYDGSLRTQVRWVGAVSGRVGVTYNNDFRVATQTVNGADAVTFGYDRDGLLTRTGALRLGRSSLNALLVADTLGLIQSTYKYSTRGELTSHHVTTGGGTVFGVGYARDSLGRIAQLFDTMQGVPTQWTFVYDSAGRLAADSVNGTIFHAFSYDGNGNRMSYTSPNGTVNYTYDDQDRLLSAGSTTYTYRSNGEVSTKTVPGVGTTTYTYDALGNLMAVVLPDGRRIDYLIDAQNRRVGRKVDGVLVQGWLYQNQLNPVAELDGSGNVVSRFVYGSRANVPDYMTKNGNTYRLISDHLGSVRLVVDTGSGTVIQRIDYDEWGKVIQNTNPGFQPFGFVGGLYDPATELTRMGARDYDPTVGRWISRDPALFGGASTNLYAYVFGDPVNWVDPAGLWGSLADWANFVAGFGDALTFGLTDLIRDWIDANGVIDKCGAWYKGGEWTEIGAELALTGGSALLKGLAKGASRSAVRAEARRLTAEIARDGNKLHHVNPLFGHPGGAPTLFPLGGLPAEIHSGGWNLDLLSDAEHLAAHDRLRMLEDAMKAGFNPLATGGRAGGNVLRSCGCR